LAGERVDGNGKKVMVLSYNIALGKRLSTEGILIGLEALKKDAHLYKLSPSVRSVWVPRFVAAFCATVSGIARDKYDAFLSKEGVHLYTIPNQPTNKYATLKAALDKAPLNPSVNATIGDYAGIIENETGLVQQLNAIKGVSYKIYTTSDNQAEPTKTRLFKEQTAVEIAYEHKTGNLLKTTDLVIGLHFQVEANQVLLHWAIVYGDEELDAEKQQKIFETFITPYAEGDKTMEAILATTAEYTLEITSFWHTLKVGYDKFRIPDEWWKGDNAFLEPFIAGFINGCIGELKSIPDFGILVWNLCVDSQQREQLKNTFMQLVNSEEMRAKLFDKLMGSAAKTARNIWELNPEGRYTIGAAIPPIVTLFLGVGLLTNGVGKGAKFAKVIDNFTDPFLAVSKAASTCVSVFYRLSLKSRRAAGGTLEIVGKGGKVLATVDNNVVKLVDAEVIPAGAVDQVLEEGIEGVVYTVSGTAVTGAVRVVRKGENIGFQKVGGAALEAAIANLKRKLGGEFDEVMSKCDGNVSVITDLCEVVDPKDLDDILDEALALFPNNKNSAFEYIFSYACFVAGTKVYTPGGYTAIEHIRTGDKVWAMDQAGGTKAIKEVTAVHVRHSPRLVRLYTGGTRIEATPEHPFYRNGAWVRAADLRP
ncbi:MAG TPA: Hint domain-containing protein, partial [Cytophagales bacterium]